jgi:hypothetical protein
MIRGVSAEYYPTPTALRRVEIKLLDDFSSRSHLRARHRLLRPAEQPRAGPPGAPSSRAPRIASSVVASVSVTGPPAFGLAVECGLESRIPTHRANGPVTGLGPDHSVPCW